ncbi:MAG: histidine phosphatase family protein [Rhodocyclales bacterium]|nr:histidine phosphatase family protein [Rhodocyclales bacterium]MDB5887833.1 histidine phosphatase family protein [Rhodocyclales bacterium]
MLHTSSMSKPAEPIISPRSGATHICLVRHGETDWNVERRLQGHEDIPLNATGVAQAGALADALVSTRFDAIYSSDLARALDTAEAVASRLGIAVTQLPAARERNFGIFQGLTRQEAEQRFPAMQARVARREPDFIPPEGESLRQCFERISVMLDALADNHAGQRILLIAHGGVLDAARRFVTGMPLDAPRDFELGNAALNWLIRAGGIWALQDWNDQSHLDISRDEVQI